MYQQTIYCLEVRRRVLDVSFHMLGYEKESFGSGCAVLWNDCSSSHWIPSVITLEPGDIEEVHSYKCLSIVIDDSITINLNRGTTEKKSKLGLYFQKKHVVFVLV